MTKTKPGDRYGNQAAYEQDKGMWQRSLEDAVSAETKDSGPVNVKGPRATDKHN